jgi:DNA-binding ferritin-like protein (Dps family)
MLFLVTQVTGRHGKLSTETLTHYHAIHKMLWTCLSHDLRQVLMKDQLDLLHKAYNLTAKTVIG